MENRKLLKASDIDNWSNKIPAAYTTLRYLGQSRHIGYYHRLRSGIMIMDSLYNICDGTYYPFSTLSVKLNRFLNDQRTGDIMHDEAKVNPEFSS